MKNSKSDSLRLAECGPSAGIRPVRLLWLLLPVILAAVLSSLLGSDWGPFLLWWYTAFVFGIGAFPLAAFFFSAFRGKGYGFSKVIGILSVSFAVWTLTYIKVTAFTRVWVILFLLALFAISWGIPKMRRAAVSVLSSPSDIRNIALEECLFVAALFVWCEVKGICLEINGEEKFMDFAFLNSLVRSNALPAPDPWLAGASINYYYYGQYIYALLTKLTGIKTSIAYNLSMCTTFAFSFTMSYSLVSLFIEGAQKNGRRAPSFFRPSAGILGAFAVTIFGNSHSFFYDEKSTVGNAFVNFLGKMGQTVGRTDSFFYPDSTRFIGHNPDSQVWDAAGTTLVKYGDYTIHEFPCYSYLLGDLHAHVVSLMIVMLIVAVLFTLYTGAKDPSGREMLVRAFPVGEGGLSFRQRISHELRHLLKPGIVITGILLGLATMCNYWDFLIYFIVACMTMLIYNIKTSRQFFSIAGIPLFLIQIVLILFAYMKYAQQPFIHVAMQVLILSVAFLGTVFLPCALTRTGLAMSFLFSLSALCSLTFNSKFDMIANSLAQTVSRTSFYQFMILWCVHIFFALLVIALALFSREEAPRSAMTGKPFVPENAVARFFVRRNPADIFMSGIAVVSFLLLLAPEIFYVRDIYAGSYKRANTMFKFTFEAFVLLSLVMAYAFFRFLLIRRKRTLTTIAVAAGTVVLALLIGIPMHYPTVAISQRTGRISLENYRGLDGTKYLWTWDSAQLAAADGDLSTYAAAIDWLNENVSGSPVICEAYGYSYTDNCIVSAYTGLPTIMGWQTHEWLWRFQGIVVNDQLISDPDKPDVWTDIMTPRQQDVTAIYQSTELMAAKDILSRYDVTYLIVGALERAAFPGINDDLMKSLGTVVFKSGDLYIVKVQ